MQPIDSNDVPDGAQDSTRHRERHPNVILAEAISRELGETHWHAARTIRRLLFARGESFVRELVQKANAIEAAGGMWLEKQQRRRSLGGVFFVLAKQELGEQTWTEQIDSWKPRRAKSGPTENGSSAPQVRVLVIEPPKKPKTPPPPPKVTSLEDGLAAARAAATQVGEVRTMKVTLIGRPGRIEKRPACVVTSMEHKKAPSLPKGLPPLPSTPTRFTVFIATKHWIKVEEALAKDPNDELVIEGFAAFMPELEGMGVFTANATTVFLQRARKQPSSQTGDQARE